jgi:hypothetical protein
MRTATLPNPTLAPANTESLLHLVCPFDCDNNLAFCGLDVTNEEWAEEGDTCVVCDELDRHGFCASMTCPGRAA